MNEYQTPAESEADDRLQQQLAALKPVVPSGFESRLVFAAGRADAMCEFSDRAGRRVWLNVAAMLIIAAGSSALTWNLAPRDTSPINSLAVSPPEELPAVPSPENSAQSIPPNQPTALVDSGLPPTVFPSLNQLLDDLFRNRLPPQSVASADDGYSASSFAQPVSTSPPTMFRLQRKLLDGNDNIF